MCEYSWGHTNINGGSLRINGDQSDATGSVTVSSGATLGGSGIYRRRRYRGQR
jgi:hypothetical protein